MTRRTFALVAALIIVAVAAFWPQPEDSVIEANKSENRTASPTPSQDASSQPPTSASAAGQRLAGSSTDLFAAAYVAPPVADASTTVFVPSVPALPFAAVGTWQEGDTEAVFISMGNQVMSVTKGQVLQQTWRLDRIEQGQLVFTHLPTKTTQTMRIAP